MPLDSTTETVTEEEQAFTESLHDLVTSVSQHPDETRIYIFYINNNSLWKFCQQKGLFKHWRNAHPKDPRICKKLYEIIAKKIAVYVDASQKGCKNGCAIIFPNFKILIHLDNDSKITTSMCEEFAIRLAGHIICKCDFCEGEYIICTDALSRINAIINDQNNMEWEIQDAICVELGWVPGHYNIPGNVEADEEAENAREGKGIKFHFDDTMTTEQKEKVKKAIEAAKSQIMPSMWVPTDWQSQPSSSLTNARTEVPSFGSIYKDYSPAETNESNSIPDVNNTSTQSNVLENPSPQSIGLEFVRQYYTLLHEAPQYLKTFYRHNSSFVHGGVEKPGEEQPPITGQQDIHKKIMSLNFRDCHAKIHQVDSQATVLNAVVVQVTGELSNNGQPMRRFMQTFVLAPQSPKKYYVHNDIFRYQDEVFPDNDSDTETQEEALESEPENIETGSLPDSVQDPTITSFGDQPSIQSNMSNGTLHLDDVSDSPQSVLKPPVVPMPAEEPKAEPEDMDEPVDMTYDPKPVTPIKAVEEPEPEPEPQVVNDTPKPFSWAALASKNSSAPAPQPAVPATIVKPQIIKADPVKSDLISSNPQPQRAPRPQRERGGFGGGRERGRERGDEPAEEGTRRSRHPDSHQLFVGNLPHNVTEKDLRDFFEVYGSVVELRINTKGSGKNVPNFGFVVFDSAEPVQKILSEKKVMIGDHRLNVEEKKQRSEGGRPGSGTRSNSRGGAPGGMRGGPGGMRSGRGGGPGGPGRGENRAGSAGPGGGGRGGFSGPRR